MTRPRRVHRRPTAPFIHRLVVNGAVAATVALDEGAPGDTPNSKERRVRLSPATRAESWVVALVTGDKVTAPFWSMSLPEALAVTNPIFVRR